MDRPLTPIEPDGSGGWNYVEPDGSLIPTSRCRCGVIYSHDCAVSQHRANAAEERIEGVTSSVVAYRRLLQHQRKLRQQWGTG